MTAESLQRLRAELVRDEGDRLDVYDDGKGHLTVGVGHNLSAHGISLPVRDLMFAEDLARAIHDATTQWPWFAELDEVRQRVLLNLIFNIGFAGVATFHRMILAILVGNYDEAANQMLASDWAGEVGQRAIRLAHLMVTGCDPAATVIK